MKDLLRRPPRAVSAGKLACAGAAALLGLPPPPAAAPKRLLPDRFFLATPKAASLCVNCGRNTEDDAREAAFCRSCWGSFRETYPYDGVRTDTQEQCEST